MYLKQLRIDYSKFFHEPEILILLTENKYVLHLHIGFKITWWKKRKHIFFFKMYSVIIQFPSHTTLHCSKLKIVLNEIDQVLHLWQKKLQTPTTYALGNWGQKTILNMLPVLWSGTLEFLINMIREIHKKSSARLSKTPKH